jgi:hypothetical protein
MRTTKLDEKKDREDIPSYLIREENVFVDCGYHRQKKKKKKASFIYWMAVCMLTVLVIGDDYG